MADLPAATTVTRLGSTVSGDLATPGAASQDFANDGSVYILIENGSLASINATIATRTITDGVEAIVVADPVVAVPASTTKIIGPFKPSVFNDQATGKVNLALSAFADVTVTALRFVNFARGD
jgi:hypothetical protein